MALGKAVCKNRDLNAKPASKLRLPLNPLRMPANIRKEYRAQTQGKVEHPYRYVRQDFFPARRFRSLRDLNAQLCEWLDAVANARSHGTTQPTIRAQCAPPSSLVNTHG